MGVRNGAKWAACNAEVACLEGDEPHVRVKEADDPVRKQVCVHVAQVLVHVHPGPTAQQRLGQRDGAVGEKRGREVHQPVVLGSDAHVFGDGRSLHRLAAPVALVRLLLEHGTDGGAVGAVRGEEAGDHVLRDEVAGQDEKVGLCQAQQPRQGHRSGPREGLGYNTHRNVLPDLAQRLGGALRSGGRWRGGKGERRGLAAPAARTVVSGTVWMEMFMPLGGERGGGVGAGASAGGGAVQARTAGEMSPAQGRAGTARPQT